MRALVLARKELRRRPVAVLLVLLLVNLCVLGLASRLPHTFTASARLQSVLPPEQRPAAGARIQAWLRAQDAAGTELAISGDPGDIALHLRAAAPRVALETLAGLVDALIESELGLLRSERAQQEAECAARAGKTAAEVQALDARLKDEVRELPAGGEAAAGARVGQLQAEIDALAIALRSDEQQREAQLGHLAAIERDIAAARAATGSAGQDADDESTRRLVAEHATLVSGIARLDEGLAARRERDAALQALIGKARRDVEALRNGGESLRALRRDYERALALDLRATEELEAARRLVATPLTLDDLPFRVAEAPVLPAHADGVPAWTWNLLALGAGLVAVTLLFLLRAPFDGRARLPEELVLGAEVAVLAVVPDYRPRPRARSGLGRLLLQATLVAMVLLAHLAFLLGTGGAA